MDYSTSELLKSLEKGLNAQDSYGRTPLMWAVKDKI